MARPLLGLLLWLIAATQALALDFSRYHAQDEIDQYLQQMARNYPDLVQMHSLGRSEQNRPVNYVVLCQGDAEHLPAIYLNGTHHGDEKASTETVLALVEFLVNNRQRAAVKDILRNYAVYLQPLVNPDGFALNTRYDAHGADPNRDYAYPGRADDESFKIPAVKLVKNLTAKVHFRAALAFHSGMEGVLWAWAHTPEKAPDHDVYYTLAKITAEAMGMTRYLQSYQDYPSNGEFIDYVYRQYGTLAMTVEVAGDSAPPARELAAVVRRAVGGAVAFMLSILELDRGQLRIEHAGSNAALARTPTNTKIF